MRKEVNSVFDERVKAAADKAPAGTTRTGRSTIFDFIGEMMGGPFAPSKKQ